MNYSSDEGNVNPGAVGTEPTGRQDTRAALLEAGFNVFARKGFDGASVRDITREAGANLGAITYHFGSKRGLYSAVLEARLSPLVERVGRAAAGTATALDRLDAVVEAFFEHLAEHPHLPGLILQEVAAGKQPPAEVVALVRRNVGYIGGILQDGWDAGELRAGHPLFTPVSIVAQPLFMNVMSPLLREVGGIDLKDPTTRKAAADHVKAFVRAALQPREEA